jgi:hypothetical protein
MNAAIHVETIRVETEIAIARDNLGSECFVDFDQVDLREGELPAFEQVAHCRNWSDSHDLRSHAADLVVNNASLRSRTQPL